ncbi:bifunctional phosphopantothenoylcysteine decarboxylase/phosphopantothenate--cysteine ligase CoaBC [bacterium]|nr:bifunctional phosphopantothenoylcysteine decarboxylase/phosphopantothenate--cysteine ligase CoaBC [bacterium]
MSDPILQETRILLGITGGISAFKSADLCRRFIKAGASVRVIMTRSAAEFITPLTMETLSGHPVYSDMFDRRRGWEIEHIAFARWGQVLVIAPATANIIAKMAAGLSDDPLSTTVLAFRGPIVIAPAMNTQMWEHPQTHENVARLRERGAWVVHPGSGALACGEMGAGRLAENEEILTTVMEALRQAKVSGQSSESLTGKRVLVTAGPTIEPIDPVRHLSNPSSGRMGYAVAREAARRGAEVTLVTGPTSIQTPGEMTEIVRVRTACEMNDAVQSRLADQDICVFCAAVSDFAPESAAGAKIKKESSGQSIELKLVRTPDVAKEANKSRQPGQFFVGFAAETDNLVRNAREKMESKGFDVVVANEVSESNPAFAAEENEAILIGRGGNQEQIERSGKTEVARKIWDFVEREAGREF